MARITPVITFAKLLDNWGLDVLHPFFGDGYMYGNNMGGNSPPGDDYPLYGDSDAGDGNGDGHGDGWHAHDGHSNNENEAK